GHSDDDSDDDCHELEHGDSLRARRPHALTRRSASSGAPAARRSSSAQRSRADKARRVARAGWWMTETGLKLRMRSLEVPLCRQKGCSDSVPALYASCFVRRNDPRLPPGRVAAERRLDRVLREPLPGQMRGRAHAAAPPGDDRRRPEPLRLERRERRGDLLGSDPAPLEVVTDRRVAEPARGQRTRPPAGEARVVEVAHALERLERLDAPRLVDPGPPETLRHLGARAVAV